MGRRPITVLGLAMAGLAALLACSGGPAEVPSGPGAAVYSQLGCGGCHGPTGEGMPAAPALTGLAAHWNQQELVAYLRDPQSVLHERPRLQYRSEQYPLQMPAYAGASQADLEALASYLLGR